MTVSEIQETRYGLKRSVELPYEKALAKTRATLQAEGFGVLTEIDIKDKMKEKLGVDYDHYIILGACNPPLAHQALQADHDIGLLLPCNVIVYADGKERSVVAALDPGMMVSMTGNSALDSVAKEAREKLRRAVEAV